MSTRLTLGPDEPPCRLDAFISRMLPLGRRAARNLCAAGSVLVNGAPRPAGTILHAGDEVLVTVSVEQAAARPEAGKRLAEPAAVLFEDEHCIVVSKPRAVHSVTLHADDPPTLADWLSAHDASMVDASPDRREAGLVQRLDFYTSGALLAAKHPDAWQSLRGALRRGEIDKHYLALVAGHPSAASWSCSLGLRQRSDGTVTARPYTPHAGLLQAATIVRVLARIELAGSAAAIVRAEAASARRHQVRAHLAASGHPLLGDRQYGGADDGVTVPGSAKVEGFMLHAAALSFPHPITGRRVAVKAESEAFERLLASERKGSGKSA